MKERIWIPPLVVLVVAASAFGVTRWRMSCASGACADSLRERSALTRELRLDNEQAAAIRKLNNDLESRLADCCMRHCAARARLIDALAADANAGTQAEAVVSQMCQAYADSERATVSNIREVRALLRPEQRLLFDRKLSRGLCASCPMNKRQQQPREGVETK